MINPLNAVYFFTTDFVRAFVALGSVVLAVTGAEALYADMGHFGRKPIRVSWIYFVLPALLLNYMGQGAMILSAAPHEALAKVKDPFFYLAPDMLRLPLVLLATAATDHRQPGGHLRRLLGHAAGDPARFRSASKDHAHQRGRCRADLHPGNQLGADDHGHCCWC